MAPLATAFVEIRPESSSFKKDSERTFSDAGKSSGTRFSEAYSKETKSRTKIIQGQVIKDHEKSGSESGRVFGKRFSEESQKSGAPAGKETGKKFGAGLAGAMAGVAVLAAQALGPALAEALDLQSVRGKLTAELGLTQGESKRIGGVAGNLYAQAYGDSMADVQTAITSVIQNMDGLRTASSSSLQDTTAKALTLSQVMGEDVGAVTRTVSQLLRTGMARNAKEAFDILTKGAQQGANKSQDLLDTFNEYPTQFRKLGLSGKTAMGIITQGLQNGARDSDLVADALKEFSIRAVDGSKLTAQGFKSLGLSGKQMAADIAAGGPKASNALDTVLDRLRGIQDPVKRSQVAVALFGTQAEDLGQALYSLDPSKAAKSLGGFAGATDKAGKALGDTAQSKFTAFKRSLQTNIVNGLVSYAIPAITGAFSTLQATIGPFFSWLSGGSTAASVLRGALFGLVAAMVAIKIATIAWTAVQTVLNIVLSANPIGLIIIAIAALVGGIILAYQHSQTFRTIVQAVWAGIKVAINAAWVVIKPIFQAIEFYIMKILVPYYKFLWSVVKIAWKGIWIAIQVAWFAIRVYWALLMAELRSIWKAFQFLYSVTRPVWQGLGRIIQSVWNTFISPTFNAIKRGLSGTKSAFSSAISAIGTTWNKLKSITKGPVSFMVNTVYMGGIRKVWEGVRGLVPGLPDIPAVHFAAGGIFPGYTPGRDVHQMPMAAFSGGEAVMVPEFTRAVGSGFVNTANKVGRRGGPMAVRAWLSGGQAFADGGILGRIKGILKKPLDLAAHAGNFILEKGADVFAKNILDPILHHIPHGDGLWARAVLSLPEKMIGGFLQFIKKTVAPSLGGGGDALGVVRAALKYVGQGDDRGVDNNNRFTRHWGWPSGTPWCALFVSSAIQDAHAQKHYRGFPTAAAAGYNSMRNVGLGEGRAGDLATYHGDGHINIIEKPARGGGYWTIGGNQNSKVQHGVRGGQGRILRPNARGGITTQAWRRIWDYEWRHNEGGEHDRQNPLVQMFSRMPGQSGANIGKNIVKAGVFDGGGVLPPGGIGFNLSRKPESVFTGDQLKVLATVGGRGGPAVEFSGDIHINDGSDLDRLMKRANFEARASGFGGV